MLYEGLFPVGKFHFNVTIGELEIPFQEVSGMEVETKIMEYRHGNSPEFYPMKGAGLMSVGNITMKKGVIQDGDELLEFFKELFDEKAHYADHTDRLTIQIELLDEEGENVMTWNVTNAIPVKYTGTDFNSNDSALAIESMEFACEFIDIDYE